MPPCHSAGGFDALSGRVPGDQCVLYQAAIIRPDMIYAQLHFSTPGVIARTYVNAPEAAWDKDFRAIMQPLDAGYANVMLIDIEHLRRWIRESETMDATMRLQLATICRFWKDWCWMMCLKATMN
jgi:hypothetical protein